MVKRRGFTLIELLIVMAILGLLMVLGMSNFQTARVKAKDAKRKSDLATIAKSLEAYANDYNKYPTSSSGKIVCKPPTTCNWGEAFSDTKGTVYTAKLPADDVSTQYYWYDSSSGTSYTLYTHLENSRDPSIVSISGVYCGADNLSCNYKVTSSNIQ